MKELLSISIALCLILGGCQSRETAPTSGQHAAAIFAVARQNTPSPTPDPVPPPSGVCENCRGTGIVGDGTVNRKCPVCGGDGRVDKELHVERETHTQGETKMIIASVLARLSLDRELLAEMQPSRRWQAVVVGLPGCKPCKQMWDDCLRVMIPSGWTFSKIGDELEREADVVYDDSGRHDAEVFPTLLFIAGEEVKAKHTGRMAATDFADWINANAKKLPAVSNDYKAIPGGSIRALDEISTAIDYATKFVGNGGSLVLTRPQGEVVTEKATIYFTGPTTIKVSAGGDSITMTCNPPPRIQIAGVPLIKPGIQGLKITRQAITLDLLRWPSVSIAVKESL